MVQYDQMVAKSFNSSAHSYHEFASLQYEIASKLCDMTVIDHEKQLTLDIGCGVGYVGRLLHNKLSIQLDIAFNMCKIAQSNCADTINANMNDLPLASDSIDIIISSMAMHWSSNLSEAIAELYRVMKNGAKLYFSIPIDNTFQEFNHILQVLNLPIINFIKYADILALLRQHNLTIANGTHKLLTKIEHSSFENFIHVLRKTGTNISKDKRFITKEIFAKIKKLYEKMFAPDGNILISWDIAYIVAIK